MLALPNLTWLRSFEAASRLGSFTAAGHELGLTQAAVSTHISALESQLGHQILERTTRKVDLTASGKAYLPSVRKALQELAVSTEGLFGSRSSGTVTIRAPISEAAMIIAPAMADFQKTHPGLDIRLLSAIWADTALETGVDIEIRLGTGNWPGVYAEPLGTETIVPVCYPELAAHMRTPSDLLEQPRIHILGFDDHWPRWLEACGLEPPGKTGRITVDTSLAAVELAAAGGGVALLLGKVAKRLTTSGRLEVPFDFSIPSVRTHYLLHGDGGARSKAATQSVGAWLGRLFV